ncbi:MAG TPA: hypothetical protein VFE30_05395 [Anaeromyxobacteraceae bacterium]|jgi:hypothetical protein|nr:hypothetical protein [Anaeromyxobacteraceae bacterium]
MKDGIAEIGDGATVDDTHLRRPATVVRVAFEGRAFWIRPDAVVEDERGDPRFVPDPCAEPIRVLRQPDGSYREDHQKHRVLLGRRELRLSSSAVPEAAGARTLASYRALFERIEPWLLRTRWYPMTYMMIPSVLAKADALIAEMEGYRGKDRDEVLELRARLVARRDGFRRIP